ncbi:MAG: DUF29 domain-containing protein [Acidithiobacillus sp.]
MATALQLEQPITNLYGTDFLAWTESQAEALRARQVDALDWANLLEEVESMGVNQRHELRSRLNVLLVHLIKWQWQPERRGTSWLTTIGNQRFEISGLLKDLPSLRRFIPEMLVDAWARARDEAEEKTGIKADTFPEGSPWDVDGKILSGWLPE